MNSDCDSLTSTSLVKGHLWLDGKPINYDLNNVPIGDQIIQLSLNGYESQSFPAIITSGQEIDLGTILFFVDVALQNKISNVFIINLVSIVY